MGDHNVLVVDDEALVVEVISAILAAGGYDVTVARTGVEALRAMDLRRPDIVLLDVVMPDMDGIALLRQLRRRENAPPVILMSGHRVGSSFLRAGALMGARAVLTKPFPPAGLLDAVRSVLAAEGAAGVAGAAAD